MTSPTGRPLRIAMIGQRGVPATFGGIERHVEELGSRLAAKGHDVTVFCRPDYMVDPTARTYRGMTLRPLDAPTHKHLEAIVHSALSSVTCLRERFDVVHYHAVGPGLMSPVPSYLSRAKVVQTVHGLDAERAKWGAVAQRVLDLGTWMSARVPDATVVVSKSLQAHFRIRYGRTVDWVTNGVSPVHRVGPGPMMRRHGLTPGRYALFVGRLVPEKAPHQLIQAFRHVDDPDLRLVLAGGSSHTDHYTDHLRALAAADPRVVLTGYVYGDDLAELYTSAGLFVNPSLVEGLPLTLLEAASYGLPVVVSDIDPHVEVLQECGAGRRLFPAGDPAALAEAFRTATADLAAEAEGAPSWTGRVVAEHDWDCVADQTEAIYRRIVGLPTPDPVVGTTLPLAREPVEPLTPLIPPTPLIPLTPLTPLTLLTPSAPQGDEVDRAWVDETPQIIDLRARGVRVAPLGKKPDERPRMLLE